MHLYSTRICISDCIIYIVMICEQVIAQTAKPMQHSANFCFYVMPDVTDSSNSSCMSVNDLGQPVILLGFSLN